MATPSAIYQTAGDNRLFYQNPQGQYTQIANPTELQSLASQGLVQVGGQRQTLPQGALGGTPPLNPSPTNPTPVTVDSSGVNNTLATNPVTKPTESIEARPGVYKSSGLTDFYQNQIERMRTQADQATTQLSDINKQISGIYAQPSLSQQFTQQSQAATSGIDATLAQRTNELNQINQSLASIEQDVRNRIAGQAPESYIQAVIAKEAQPLVRQQQALQENVSLLQNQRQQALQSVQQAIGLSQADREQQLGLLNFQQNLAKQTVDSFNTLIEKGAAASQQEKENAQQLFLSFLEKSPGFLAGLTDEEKASLQQGIIPNSALTKLSQEAKKSTKREIIGSKETGYYTVDPFTSEKTLIISPSAPESSVSESDIRTLATTLYDRDPSITSFQEAYAQAASMLRGGGTIDTRVMDTRNQAPAQLTYEQFLQEKYPAQATALKMGIPLRDEKLKQEYEAYKLLTQPEPQINDRVSQGGRRKDDKYLAAADRLRNDFTSNQVVKDYNIQRAGYEQSQIIDPNTANPQEDMALIFSFMKILDPGSVVREGEFATAQKYTSFLDGLGVKLDTVTKGNLLSTKQRENIRNAMQSKFNLSQSAYDKVVKSFETQGRNAKVDPQDFIIDYSVNTPSGDSRGYVESLYGGGGFNNVPSTTLNGSLGSLSARFESKGNPGVIGYDNTGGLSYGAYQLAHNNAQIFVNQSKYANEFKGIPFNSQQFQNKWKQVAARDPQGFLQAQHDFIQKTHFEPQVKKLESAGIDVASLPQVVKDVIWSTAVQHGPNNDIIKQAFAKTKSGDPAELIRNIYALRWAGGRNFARSTPDVKQGVYNRFFSPNGEQATALAALQRSNNLA